MAYGRNANTWATATDADTLSGEHIKVYSVQFLNNDTNNAQKYSLEDKNTSVIKIQAYVPASSSTLLVFREPILFPTGIKVNLGTTGECIVQLSMERA